MASKQARRGAGHNVGRSGKGVARSKAKADAGQISYKGAEFWPIGVLTTEYFDRQRGINGEIRRIVESLPIADSGNSQLRWVTPAFSQEEIESAWKDALADSGGVAKAKARPRSRKPASKTVRRVHAGNRAKGKQCP